MGTYHWPHFPHQSLKNFPTSVYNRNSLKNCWYSQLIYSHILSNQSINFQLNHQNKLLLSRSPVIFILLNPMSIFNSHLNDLSTAYNLSTAYDIVLNVCCWLFLSSLISQHCFSAWTSSLFTPLVFSSWLIVSHDVPDSSSSGSWIPWSEWP